MAEEKGTETVTNPASGAGTENVTATMTADEIKKLVADSVSTATAELVKTHKAEKSGLDKTITQLQRDKEALELQGKTDKEKAEILTRKEAEEKAKIEADFRKEKADFAKLKYASSLKLPEGILPADITEFFTGKDDDEIKVSADKFNALITKIKAAGAAALIDGVDNSPGKSTGNIEVDNIKTLEAQLYEAKKDRNADLANIILNKIKALKEKKK